MRKSLSLTGLKHRDDLLTGVSNIIMVDYVTRFADLSDILFYKLNLSVQLFTCVTTHNCDARLFDRSVYTQKAC
jgi:hypothetical protein